MNGLMLVVRMGGETVALDTGQVESVVEIEALSTVPLAPPHFAGLAALRSRVVTMIDPRAVLGAPGLPVKLPAEAVIVPVDGHPYGLLVDEVLDVLSPDGPVEPARAAIDPAWAGIAAGTVTFDGRLHLLIDPARLIAGPGRTAEGI